MGKDKWAKVIEYLESKNRDPEKTLKLLKGNDKGVESNYSIARSSYSMNVIATITQKKLDPKNKGKSLTHVIRTWVKSKDFQSFYDLMGTGSGIGKRNIKENLFGASKEIIKEALPKLKKRFKTKNK